jgi:hypothetical protein
MFVFVFVLFFHHAYLPMHAQVIEREHGIPVARQAFFRIVRRENGTFRPNHAVPAEDYGGKCFGPLDLSVRAHLGDRLPKNHPVWGPSMELKDMIPPKLMSHTHFYLVELPEQVCVRPADREFSVFCQALFVRIIPIMHPLHSCLFSLISTGRSHWGFSLSFDPLHWGICLTSSPSHIVTQTCRVSLQVSPAAAAVGCATAASFRAIDLPLLVRAPSSPPAAKSLLSFKFFDVRTQRLEFVGSRVVRCSATVGDLLPMLRYGGQIKWRQLIVPTIPPNMLNRHALSTTHFTPIWP